MIDVLGIVVGALLIAGLAVDVYRLGRRNGYDAGQADAALDFRRGYRRAITDVIVEAERQGPG